jgi:hypothetical protein
VYRCIYDSDSSIIQAVGLVAGRLSFAYPLLIATPIILSSLLQYAEPLQPAKALWVHKHIDSFKIKRPTTNS